MTLLTAVMSLLMPVAAASASEVRWYPVSMDCQASIPDSALKKRLKSVNSKSGKLDCVLVPSVVGTTPIHSLNCTDEFEIMARTRSECRKVLRVLRQGSK